MRKLVFITCLLMGTCLTAHAVDVETLRRSIAANEKQIARFEKAKETLQVESAEAQKLDQKIKRLELENQTLFQQLPAENIPKEEKPFSQLKGSDWPALSSEEKESFIRKVSQSLGERGIIVLKPFSFYIEEMDRVIQLEPRFGPEYLSGIFVFCVHRNEPELREALKKIRP